jgi:ADP-heptose:LPS heptosyltransferase
MNYLHSGSLGDVVYCIPTIRSLQALKAEPFAKANLYLKPDVPGTIPTWAGTRANVRMSGAEAERLIPLLTGQQGLNEVAIYQGQDIDINLDKFRDTGFGFDRGDICRYYAYAFKSHPALWKPWLKVEPSKDYAGAVLVSRTTRYQNPGINYRFLARRPNVYFVGYPDEYTAFNKECSGLPRLQAKDARELASWIAGAKCLIGNQSFPFALAEAMKTTRLLEVFPAVPNVVIHGPKGWDAINQNLFEDIAEGLMK